MEPSPIAFGKTALEHFSFDAGWRNLNNGSFGGPPTVIKDRQRYYQDQCDARPDEFIRYEYPVLLDQAREAAAELLNAPTESVVLVPNATVGINTVFRNLKWTKDGGDVVISFSTVYEACGKIADFVVDYFDGKVTHREIALEYPIEDDEIIERFRQTVDIIKSEGKRARICIFDAVSSRPGVVFPWQTLTRVCRELNILSMLDGAQGVGMIPIDLSAHEPDFFVTNCHKWLNTPRGCAIFYTPVRNQHLLPSTLATSHGYMPQSKSRISPLPPSKKSNFISSFEYNGTLDNSQYLTIVDALEWRRRFGGEKAIMDYLWKLSKEGGQVVAHRLGTEVMENGSGTLTNCALSNVALPVWIDGVRPSQDETQITVKAEDANTVLQWLHVTLRTDHRSFLPFYIHGGRYWVRISSQVYLDLEDYEWAAAAIQDLCDRVQKREYAQK